MNWIGGEKNAGDARKMQSQDHYDLLDHMSETDRGPKKKKRETEGGKSFSGAIFKLSRARARSLSLSVYILYLSI